MSYPFRAEINLASIRHNVSTLAGSTPAALMAVVKADAYGHGATRVAQAALEAGASWLGVAQVAEALPLAESLPGARIFSWLYTPSTDLAPAIRTGIDLSVGSPKAAEQVAEASRRAGTAARVHLALDTGMAREGVRPELWGGLVTDVLARPELKLVGMWSHLARADEEGKTTDRQAEIFAEAAAEAERLGATFEVRHLANSAGTAWHPATHHDLVRTGIALYGLAPDGSDPAALGLKPAMRLVAKLASVRDVPAGTPVSYGGTAVVGPTRLGTVPVGYADGVPRQASGRGLTVGVAGRRAHVVGRICMDQFVIDLGKLSASPGDPVVVWGPGGASVDEWAAAAGTINYTITTQLAARVPRHYVEEPWN